MDDKPNSEITITIPTKQAITRHIEDLQATLAKRNAEIERLTERLKEAEAGEPNQHALGAAHKRGWQAAAHLLMNASADAAKALGKLRKDAFDIYLESEKRDF